MKRWKQKATRAGALAAALVLLASALAACSSGAFMPSGEAPVPAEGTPFTAEAGQEAAYVKMAENGRLGLYMRPADGNFYVENKADGYRWYANPENAQEDSYAANIYKMELSSSLIIGLYDLQKSTMLKKNSEAASVRKGGLALYAIPDGFRAEYTFKSEGVTVPLEITLGEDFLDARIITSAIREEIRLDESGKRETAMSSVRLLPNFGASTADSSGYIVMPDGCGALMYFGNGKSMMEEYYAPVYGNDLSSTVMIKPNQVEKVMLPVFGISTGTDAFLSVITKGDAAAILHAVPALQNSSYGQGYAEYLLRSTDSYMLDYQSVAAQTIKLYQTNEYEIPACQQRYYFLDGENADYSGMAVRYRRYLTGEQGVVPAAVDPSEAFLDFYCAVRKTEPVLGIPVERTKILSTLDSIGAFLDELESGGTGAVSVRLLEWSRDRLAGKLDTRLKMISGVGGGSGLADLDEKVRQTGGTLSLGVDPVEFTRNGNGYTGYSEAAKSLSNTPAYQYLYNMATRMRLPEGRGYLLNPLYFDKEAGSLLSSLANGLKQVRLSPYTLGSCSYGSYGTALVSREDAKNAAAAALKKLRGQIPLVLDDPAGYAIGYADLLAGLPLSSSRYDLFDRDIPFYQIAVSGLRPYTTVPINLESNADEMVLFAAETGAIPHYALLTGDNKSVIDTKLNTLFSAETGTWKDSLAESLRRLSDLRAAAGGSAIASQEWLAPSVSLTLYENGTKVLVNFGTSAYEDENGSIGPKDFMVKKGDENR